MPPIKKILILITLLAALSANARTKSVERPVYVVTNQTTLDIEKVELTDSATRVTFSAKFRPGWWIQFNSKSRLNAAGKDYGYRSAEGIIPDTHHTMPASGRDTFTVSFDPLPFDTEFFNFMEGDDQNDWRFYGIDLSGKMDPFAIPTGLPEIKAPDLDRPMPRPVFEHKPAVINFQLLNWRPGLPSKVCAIPSQENVATFHTIDSTGFASITCDLHHTNIIRPTVIDCPHNIWQTATVNPGDTVTFYLDLMAASDSRRNGTKPPRTRIIGPNAEYDRMVAKDLKSGLINEKFILPAYDYRKHPDDVIRALIDSCRSAKRYVTDSKLPLMETEYLNAMIDNSLFGFLGWARYYLEKDYIKKHNLDVWPGDPSIPRDSLNTDYGPKHYAMIADEIDIDNPLLFIVGGAYRDIYTEKYAPSPKPGSLYNTMTAYAQAYTNARHLKLTDKDIETLRSSPYGYLADICIGVQDSLKAKIEKMPKANIRKTPDVEPGKIIETIVAEHPGKVVVIDLWNTWCGPCRMTMESLKPVKAELADKDVVWVYIGDESSSLDSYYEMIPSIHGLHYLLTEEQMDAVHEKYRVDGIPFFIVADRKGNLIAKPELRDLNLLKTTILQKLAESAD